MTEDKLSLNRVAGIAYVFLLVGVVDPGTDLSETVLWELSGVSRTEPVFIARWGGQSVELLSSNILLLGLLVLGAVAIFGLYLRTMWGLIGSVGVFIVYGALLFSTNEWTVGGLAALCALYFLSRADAVHTPEGDAV